MSIFKTNQAVLAAMAAISLIRCGYQDSSRPDHSEAQATHEVASFRTPKNVSVVVAPPSVQEIVDNLPEATKTVVIDFDCFEGACNCDHEVCHTKQGPGAGGKATVLHAAAPYRTNVHYVKFWTNEIGAGDAILESVRIIYSDGTDERLVPLESRYNATSGLSEHKTVLAFPEKKISKFVVIGQNFTQTGGRLRFNVQFEIPDEP